MKKMWPKSATKQAAIIGSAIGGVFMIITALIDHPFEKNNEAMPAIDIQIRDKLSGRLIPGVEIDVKQLGKKHSTDENGTFELPPNQIFMEKISIIITAPIDSVYLQRIPLQKGVIYDSIRFDSK